jgi:hypothetical protein
MNYQNGYKGISVEVIEYTKHPAKIMWDMLKQTWVDLHNTAYDCNSKLVKTFIEDSLAKRLNPVPQETILIQVIFKGISRVNLAQITRQRGWIFNSESQMPQHTNHNVIIPLNIVNSPYYERAKKLIEDSQKLYDDMTKGNNCKDTTNIPYQDARYMLLNGQTADIAASFDITRFVSCCGMRLENNTHDEINYLCRLTIKALKDRINEDTEIDCLDKLVYNTILNSCDVFGANRKVCTCYDAMFGNSFKRYPDANNYVTEVTNNCLFDYTKLAWYQELKRMYDEEPELLLPGEKEMIENWKYEK